MKSFLLALLAATPLAAASFPPDPSNQTPDQWREERRLIDLHQHISFTEEHLARAIRIMDEAGIGIGANLSGGYVTASEEEASAFEKNKALADRLFPGRFIHYMNLNYSGWNEPDFTERAVEQIEKGHRLGAAGLKEYKRLGLFLRDGEGRLIKVDDPKLDPVWAKCGELGMPVSIHVADPKAFWEPYDSSNERWTELKDHRNWWFGDPEIYPPREELLTSLNHVIERHPNTTFVCVHFANNAEDLDWVEASLDRFPNMMADLGARIPEIGRHDPGRVRRLFLKHQDRILFATDFMVYDRLILGSGGSGPGPTDYDALTFFKKHWRWLETNDRDFEHMTPIQGDWTISAIGLPSAALRKVYFDNARQLLAGALPRPTSTATKIPANFELSGDLSHAAWQTAAPIRVEYQSLDAKPRPALAASARILWSDTHLYVGFVCPFTELTVFEPARLTSERLGLWDRDVVELFIGTTPSDPETYWEFEVAPTGEKLDVVLKLPEKDFEWDSGFEAKTSQTDGLWMAEFKIPFAAMGGAPPKSGDQWSMNLYRADRANNAYLAWNPTLRRTFHAPDRFGAVVFQDNLD